MRTGDLVAIRFDGQLAIGVLTGTWQTGAERTFLYPDGKRFATGNLPRSRFIELQSKPLRSVENLLDLTWEGVEARYSDDDAKLKKWIDAASPCPVGG